MAANDTEAAVAKGEGKRFIIDLVLPEATIQKIASVSFAAISPIENEKLPLCDIVCINIKYILYY
jgi:hypothetical protein